MKTAIKNNHIRTVVSSRREKARRDPREVIAKLTALRKMQDENHEKHVQDVLEEYYKFKAQSRA